MGPMGGAGMGLQVGGQPSPPMPLHGGGIMGGMEGVLLDGMAVRACTWPCPRRALAACAATCMRLRALPASARSRGEGRGGVALGWR